MARLNPNPIPTPRRIRSAPALESAYSSQTYGTALNSSYADVQPQAEQEIQPALRGSVSSRDLRQPTLIITRRSRQTANLTFRKRARKVGKEDPSRLYPFLSNVVYLELPSDSEDEMHETEVEHNSDDSYKEDIIREEEEEVQEEVQEEDWEVQGQEEEKQDEKEQEEEAQERDENDDDEHVEKQVEAEAREDEQEQEEDGDDSAYGSVDIPDAGCPSMLEPALRSCTL